MTERSSPGKIQFATPAQLALLRAGLLEGSAAAEAASCWLALLGNEATAPGLRQLDLASRRLLPLVYRNVKHLLPPRFQVELRWVHHEYWAENQKYFRRLQELLPWFEADGIPTLVLKGMALSILHYRDMALRPMSDLDILVPEERAPEIVSRLLHNGWTFDSFLPSALANRYFYRHTHAISFTHRDYGDSGSPLARARRGHISRRGSALLERQRSAHGEHDQNSSPQSNRSAPACLRARL